MGFFDWLFGGGEEKREGVGVASPSHVGAHTTVDSGLQYTDLKAGDGASVSKGNEVTVHYTGWLANGK